MQELNHGLLPFSKRAKHSQHEGKTNSAPKTANFCLGVAESMLVLITPGANSTEVASYGTKVPYPATAPE